LTLDEMELAHGAAPGEDRPRQAAFLFESLDRVDDPEGDDEEWEPPEIERNGTVRIEDPDENGEFSDTDWCEEC